MRGALEWFTAAVEGVATERRCRDLRAEINDPATSATWRAHLRWELLYENEQRARKARRR